MPLLLALSDAAVYPSSAGKMNETAAIGGRTREGLEASILQMAILGAARGLTGDAGADDAHSACADFGRPMYRVVRGVAER